MIRGYDSVYDPGVWFEGMIRSFEIVLLDWLDFHQWAHICAVRQ